MWRFGRVLVTKVQHLPYVHSGSDAAGCSTSTDGEAHAGKQSLRADACSCSANAHCGRNRGTRDAKPALDVTRVEVHTATGSIVARICLSWAARSSAMRPMRRPSVETRMSAIAPYKGARS
jgi:hypothetical protein